MTVVTLRPADSAGASQGSVFGGAGSFHAAYSDDSDSTWTQQTTGHYWMGNLGNLTLPAGALIKSITPRVRAGRVGASGVLGLTAALSLPGSNPFQTFWQAPPVTWTTGEITTFTFSPYTYTSYSATDLNSWWARIEATGSAGIYGVYFDVKYVEKPELTIDAPAGTVEDTNLPIVVWMPR
jgi:hypothetical protein